MSIHAVLLPVLIQVGLVFVLLGFLAKTRQDALNGIVRERDIALSGDAYPQRSRQVSNCYANQFEMPVLFLLAVMFGWVLHQTGWLFVTVEWVFIVCRIAHAVVHTTVNRVPLRGVLFLGSALATALLWVLITLGVFFGVVI